LALEWAELRNLNLKSPFSIFGSFRDIRAHIYEFFKFVGVNVGVANWALEWELQHFLSQSIGIDG